MINKKLFKLVESLAHDLRENSAILDKQIRKEYGFNYSDVDFDKAIDSLDYGQGHIDYDYFIKEMNEFKLKRELKQ